MQTKLIGMAIEHKGSVYKYSTHLGMWFTNQFASSKNEIPNEVKQMRENLLAEVNRV